MNGFKRVCVCVCVRARARERERERERARERESAFRNASCRVSGAFSAKAIRINSATKVRIERTNHMNAFIMVDSDWLPDQRRQVR